MKERIVASLTTIPPRLHQLQESLTSILSDSGFDRVILTIPERSLKGKEYSQEEIDELVRKVDPEKKRLFINRIPKDFGPITKLVGCFNVVTDPETTIVVFDDDRKLLKPVSRIFDERCQSDPRSVYSFGGWCFGSGYKMHIENMEDIEVDSIMGTTCIAMRRGLIPDMNDLLNYKSEDTRLLKLDDLRISGYLSSKGIRRVSIGYNVREYLRDISYENSDSLHGNFKFWVDNKGVIDTMVREGIFKVKSAEGTSIETIVLFSLITISFLGSGIWLTIDKGKRRYGLILLAMAGLFGTLLFLQIQHYLL